MYETHDADTGHVLAIYDTVTEALADGERFVALVEAQLAANGEGHRDLFWVHLPIYEVATGKLAAANVVGLLPTPARRAHA